MRHIGQLLKEHIESHQLKKRDVAESAGITYNYLSTIFRQKSCDAELWERLCHASGLNPAIAFDSTDGYVKNYSDIHAQTVVGPATVNIATEQKVLLDLLAEKERLIQVLLATSGIKIGTESEQIQEKSNT